MSDTSDRELDLWKKWKAGGEEETARELLESLSPLIKSQTQRFQGRLPPSSVQARAYVLARKSLDGYDPDKGAKLSTHVVNQLKPLSRLSGKHQDIAYIPEARQKFMGRYRETMEELTDENGRVPNDAEVADRMGVGLRQIGLLRKENWRDVVDAGPMASIHPFAETSQKGDVLNLVYHDLGPREKLVFERVVGYNGHPVAASSFVISSETGISVTEVESMKKRIQALVKQATT